MDFWTIEIVICVISKLLISDLSSFYHISSLGHFFQTLIWQKKLMVHCAYNKEIPSKCSKIAAELANNIAKFIHTSSCAAHSHTFEIYKAFFKYSMDCLTTGFWGKEAWRPPQKWNTYLVFLYIFQKNSAMATLSLEKMEKFLQT